jgi:hypothetical protein
MYFTSPKTDQCSVSFYYAQPSVLRSSSSIEPMDTNMPNLIPDIDTPDLIANIDNPSLIPMEAIPTIRTHSIRRSVTLLLNLLDSRVRPGVTEDEFRWLFVRCDCGYILTRRASRDHACGGERAQVVKNNVIDLTGDDQHVVAVS